jgi:hypothetical protein
VVFLSSRVCGFGGDVGGRGVALSEAGCGGAGCSAGQPTTSNNDPMPAV